MVTTIGQLEVGDFLLGIPGETNTLTGDAETMTGNDIGGHDWILGGKGRGTDNILRGEAEQMWQNGRGGDDVLFAGKNSGLNLLEGEADGMNDSAVGGKDSLFGGDGADVNFLVGDGAFMRDNTVGEDDLLVGGDWSENLLHGEGLLARNDAQTGNDKLIGGNHASNFMVGDAYEMRSSAPAGHDMLIGGRHSSNSMNGDAFRFEIGRGGNDRVVRGAHSDNDITGDARFLSAQGGNDVLFAGDSGTNLLYGDAYQMLGTSVGGNDRLVSGHADDDMWGDAKFRSGLNLEVWSEDDWFENPPEIDETVGGSDVFVFRPHNGDDTIHDFEPGKDVIELRNFGRPWNPWEFDDLTISTTIDGCVISLGGQNSITVLGVDELTSDDVRFRSDLSWSDVLIS